MSGAVAGLVIALPEECRSLTRRRVRPGDCLAVGEGRLVCVAGVGQGNARRAAETLIESGASGLVSWGCAGALSPRLRPGDLCLPEEIIDMRGGRRRVSADWHRSVREALQSAYDPHTGPALTVDRLVRTPAEKQVLEAGVHAEAVDMESAEIAAVAWEHALPFLAVRAIADPADMALPAAVVRATGADGRVNRSVLLAQTLLHLGEVGELLRLASHFRAALRTLTGTADRLGCALLLGAAFTAVGP